MNIFRYIIAGGASYAVELILIILLIELLGLNGTISVSISFWVGLVVAFILQKKFTFNQNHSRKTHNQMLLYILLVIVNYIFTITFVALFSHIIGTVIARTGALIITTVWNYLIYKFIIFR